MVDLNYNPIRHLPKEHIPKENIFWLGFWDGYEFLLVIEEWEFRIYNYEYWSDESIYDSHQDEDWWTSIQNYFWVWDDCLDTDTCEYSVAKFENDTPIAMAGELLAVCREKLDDLNWALDDNWWPSTGLIGFIARGIVENMTYGKQKVYTYYK